MDPLVRPSITRGDLEELADCHVEPPSVEYLSPVTGDPPLAPSSNSRYAERSRALLEEIVGALGVVLGVAHRSADATPEPAAFTARTCTQ